MKQMIIPQFTHLRLVSILLVFASLVFAEVFSIQYNGDNCSVYLGRQLLVENVKSGLARAAQAGKTICTLGTRLNDGRQIHNAWCEDEEYRFRLEIELAADGSYVEFTTKTEIPAYCVKGGELPPQLCMDVPGYVLGNEASYCGYSGYGRAVWRREGSLSNGQKMPGYPWRFFVLNAAQGRKLTFDCNPVGPGEVCSMFENGVIKGMAQIQGNSNGLSITFTNGLNWFGGMTAAKLRISLGGMENYAKNHALDCFNYNWPLLPFKLLSFGSEKHGNKFTSADDAPFSQETGYGWLDARQLRKTTTTSGAFYSHVSGKDAVFRFVNLMQGLHLITVGAGNPDGTSNHFSCIINGQRVFEPRTISRGKMMTATLPIWIDNGIADIAFEGDFLVSVIGDQRLLANREDYQCRRGFWAVDGYEPSVLFRNIGYQPPALKFLPSVMEEVLPVAGQETAGPQKEFRADLGSPLSSVSDRQWLFRVKFKKLGNNTSSLNELSSPEAMERFMAETVAEGRNAIMLSGQHARHVYPASNERVFDYIRRFCDCAHRYGLKVIDHHDTTLLWNTEAGFRNLAERISEVNRSLDTQLPGAQLCAFNPTFLEKYKAYLAEIVRCGVDGLQIDELGMFSHACSCQHCRYLFHKETGWWMPMDETQKWMNDYQRDITKAWMNWKLEHTLSIRSQLIAEMHKINPNLAILDYGILKNLVTQQGLRAWNCDMMREGQNASMYGHECLAKDVIRGGQAFIAGQKFFNFFRYNNGIPIFTWLYTRDWHTSYFGYAVCNMNAQVPIFFASGTEVRPKDAPDFIQFDASAENMDISRARPIARVALLMSDHTCKWEDEYSMAASLFGCAQALEALHIPYQVISEDTLSDEAKLRPFNVIILGMASCLSNEDVSCIRNFVKRGGTVLLGPKVATKDHWGHPRTEWPLKDVFGFTLITKNSAPGTAVAAVVNKRNIAFARPLKCHVPIPAKGGQVSGWDWQLLMNGGKYTPLAYECASGKGRFVYVPVSLATHLYNEDFTGTPNPKFELDTKAETVFHRVLKRVLKNSDNQIRTDAPPKVHLTLYQNDNELYLHLLNGLGAACPTQDSLHTPMEKLFPPLTQDIGFSLYAPRTVKVYAVSPDFPGRQELAFNSRKDGTVSFTLPAKLLKVYTIIKLQQSGQ